MIKIEDKVYCDVHGCVHDKSKWPYDVLQHDKDTQDADGNQVLMVYVDLDAKGEVVPEGEWLREKRIVATVPREADPDCEPENWRVVWAGRTLA